ncbi:MAG: hypothetical protein WD766_14875 [Gemmatimonadota bacterium]
MKALRRLIVILRIPKYRRMAAGIGGIYLVLFLIALQDISLGGRGFEFLTVDWARMFDRTGAFTFEPIGQLTMPGLTILLSPVNILIGLVVAALVGVNLVITYIAFSQPSACTFNRSTGILASVPALVAGSACCAPAIVLILGLQVSSLFITVFQVLIPVSMLLLLFSLKLILDRTVTELIDV